MSKYKESTLKTYANKLERKFKNDCYFVCATHDVYSELVIGATVIFDNQGIKNRYDINCWVLEDGNINVEFFKNDARLKSIYCSVEMLSLNYAIDYIYEYVMNDNEETKEAAEKHYDDYTSEDFINAGIAKECTECPDFCEEDCIENVECAKGNDVFEGCKTVKDVMEVKNELNTRYGKEQYFDTDSLQPNKKIIAKIENINCCPNRNTCCFVTHYANCDYNYKSDSCIKAYNYFIHDCEQMHKHMKARSNPEWHHVNLETVHNIDSDMLDEKRQLYFKLYRELKETCRNLRKCKNVATFDKCSSNIRAKSLKMYCNDEITALFYQFILLKLSMLNVECGMYDSSMELATNMHESRRYNKNYCN